MSRHCAFAAALVCALAATPPALAGITPPTVFTYQGQLVHLGQPVTTPTDLTFRLFDEGGNQIGVDTDLPNFAAFDSEGRFSVDLDFGTGPFNGQPLFLEIEAEGVVLAPRQPIRPAPYALMAFEALNIDAAALPANVALEDSSNYFEGSNVFALDSIFEAKVGVGANPPGAPLHVRADETAPTGFTLAHQIAVEPFSTNHDVSIGLRTTQSGGREWSLRAGSGAPNSNLRVYDATAGADRLNIDANGDVGIGTTDPQARLHVVQTSAGVAVILPGLRVVQTGATPNVIGGSSDNTVAVDATGATIAGGGQPGVGLNQVTGTYGTVGGGFRNSAAQNATVGGGEQNTASANGAVIGGGYLNGASGGNATVAGGEQNSASNNDSTVGGGQENVASGPQSTVPGGYLNTASGAWSFAGGRQAKATHTGSFVWGGGSATDVGSTADETFIVRASGGVWFGTAAPASIPAGRYINTSSGGYLSTAGVWTNNSSRERKENFQPVDPRQVAAELARLPIRTWNYKVDDDTVIHMGPVAEEFAETFGLGADDKAIGTVDADGVALAAIQGVYQLLLEKDSEIAALKARLEALERRLPSP